MSWLLILASALVIGAAGTHQLASRPAPNRPVPFARWSHGPPADPGYFPIAVWLQSPENARRYQQAGINLYVGLWQGPTEKQLAELKAAGMPVICEQNPVGLAHKADRTIVGWMHGDEPDNAQPVTDPATGKDRVWRAGATDAESSRNTTACARRTPRGPSF